MTRRRIVILVAVAMLVLAAIGGTTAALAGGGDVTTEIGEVDDVDTPGDKDIPITGPDLERASAAALEFTGEGRVTETEVEDEESYYEVEVTLDSGRQIDVQLDEQFNVVGTD